MNTIKIPGTYNTGVQISSTLKKHGYRWAEDPAATDEFCWFVNSPNRTVYLMFVDPKIGTLVSLIV